MKTPARRGGGFTLIEVMIVVAIIGILAAVAYPSYIQYITKSHRRAAQAYMLEVSSRQQRYLLDAREYADADTTAKLGTLLNYSPPAEVSGHYDVTSPRTANAKPPGFTVVATPKAAQATRDAGCGTLTIDQVGTKTVSGTQGATTCW